MANANNKDVLYIDIDDEITTVIDKLLVSDGKIVALVLPKRATVFQSIVNMKLLKRSADNAKKRLVLITSEAGLLPLAGAVGLHVAKSLQSRPEIPPGPPVDEAPDEVVEEELLGSSKGIDLEKNADASIGDLAAASASPLAALDADETIELDDDDLDASKEVPAAAAATKAFKAPKKNKKLMVPNFERFRLWLVLGGLALILLIIGLVFASSVLPKAVINIQTDASNVNTNVTFTADTGASAVDPVNKVVPAKQVQSQKQLSQSVPATGQKNAGDKAKGTIKIINCSSGDSVTVPAGTGVSAGGLTYITQDDVNLPVGSKSCKDIPGATSDTVSIVAQAGGAKYNMSSGTPFTVAGYSSVTQASATKDITGGTDNFVKVVAQADIDKAKQQLTSQNSDEIKQDLQQQLEQQGYYALLTTFNAPTPDATATANPGDTADTVTVNETLTSTMLGIKKNDLKGLVDDNIKEQIDTSKQGILDEGLDHAIFKVLDASASTSAKLNIQTTAQVGPDIDVASIKQEVAGKRAGEIRSTVQNDPDVTSVDVHLSPFWVTKAPKKLNKITVIIAKPTKTVGANANQ